MPLGRAADLGYVGPLGQRVCCRVWKGATVENVWCQCGGHGRWCTFGQPACKRVHRVVFKHVAEPVAHSFRPNHHNVRPVALVETIHHKQPGAGGVVDGQLQSIEMSVVIDVGMLLGSAAAAGSTDQHREPIS